MIRNPIRSEKDQSFTRCAEIDGTRILSRAQ